jgi:hypothetical protein
MIGDSRHDLIAGIGDLVGVPGVSADRVDVLVVEDGEKPSPQIGPGLPIGAVS